MPPDFPVVSVIMPAYNAAAFVAESIESVLHQSYPAFELIVVDDGSSDDTAAIVERYTQADARVQLIRCRNSGKPSIARNIGIERATGDYLSFLDSDDVWLPERLSRTVAAMRAHPEWIAAFHDIDIVDSGGRKVGPTYLENGRFLAMASSHLRALDDGWHDCGERFFVFMSLQYGAVHTQSIIIDRRQAGAALLRFDEDYIICEDTDLWLRLALRGRFGYLDSVLSCYRQHPTSITKKAMLFAEQTLLFHENNYARVQSRMTADERRAYRRKIAGCKSVLAYHCYLGGKGRQARVLSLEAFATCRRYGDLLLSAKTFIPPLAQQRIRALLGK
jgi:glycosyltransferase involved in cell wall biosynthesis